MSDEVVDPIEAQMQRVLEGELTHPLAQLPALDDDELAHLERAMLAYGGDWSTPKLTGAAMGRHGSLLTAIRETRYSLQPPRIGDA